MGVTAQIGSWYCYQFAGDSGFRWGVLDSIKGSLILTPSILVIPGTALQFPD